MPEKTKEELELENGNGTGGEPDKKDPDVVDVIKHLKEENATLKEKEKLASEQNKRLLQEVLNGEEHLDNKEQSKEDKVDLNELRKDLFKNPFNNNLSYCKKALKLREEIISKGGIDPFIPVGSKYKPTDADVATAQKVADVFKQCIEYADGDNELFTNELQRRTEDISGLLGKRFNRHI